MKEELNLVREFHEKMGSPVLQQPSLIPEERSGLRYRLMKEEVEEYLIQGVQEKDLPNIVKELADVYYTLLGTILEHGLQEVFPNVFREVHASNMSKEPSFGKAIKGPNYFKPDLSKFFPKKEDDSHN